MILLVLIMYSYDMYYDYIEKLINLTKLTISSILIYIYCGLSNLNTVYSFIIFSFSHLVDM